MAKNSVDAYKASGKTNLLFFDPSKLTLVTDEKHPLYDPRVKIPLSEEMIMSIMYRGVVEPIAVIKDTESGDVLVVDGRQRVKNAIEANARLKKQGLPIKTIAGKVVLGGMKAATGDMVLANEGRVPPTPTGRAHMAQKLLASGYNEAEVATLLHVSKQTLAGYLAMLKCTSEVRKAVEAGHVLPTLAKKLATFEPAEQKRQLGVMLQAAEGSQGKRVRARKMREATGEARMRGRRAVLVMRGRIEGLRPDAKTTLGVLDWVLGGPEPEGLEAEETEETEGTEETAAE